MFRTSEEAKSQAKKLAQEEQGTYFCVLVKEDGLYYVCSPEEAWMSIVYGEGWDLLWKLIFTCQVSDNKLEYLEATSEMPNILDECIKVGWGSHSDPPKITISGVCGKWFTPGKKPQISETRMIELLRRFILRTRESAKPNIAAATRTENNF